MMRLSDAGRDAIIQREGLRLTAYTCPAGKLTIGIGHTGPDVKRGLRITEARAYDLLARDIAPAENLLNSLGVTFTQGQFDALLSFILNIGITSFKKIHHADAYPRGSPGGKDRGGVSPVGLHHRPRWPQNSEQRPHGPPPGGTPAVSWSMTP